MGLTVTEADLARWMQTLGPRLLAVSRAICRDSQAAEDVVQEAFVKLWRTPPDGPEKVVPSWMKRVVVNLSINHLRRTKRAETLPDFSHDPALRNDIRPEEQVDLDDNMRRVRSALGRLPEDKRAIIVMRVYEKMSYQDIADTLGVPIGTVMSRLNRARAALKEEVERGLMRAEDDPLVFPLFRDGGRATGGGAG
ncbi:MAG: RNA polymerase sigma factor [Phycisphaerales bacterium]